ncbi:MAG: hypothetical protein AB7J32_19605 [Pseudonocardia sp.]
MSTDRLAEAAVLLRRWPTTQARLRERHVAGPDGRCRGCSSATQPAPRWPCTLALVVSWPPEAG